MPTASPVTVRLTQEEAEILVRHLADHEDFLVRKKEYLPVPLRDALNKIYHAKAFRPAP